MRIGEVTDERLRELVRSAAVVAGKKRYSTELRMKVIKYSRQRMSEGLSQNQIAEELGMNSWTLNRWHQNERKTDGMPVTTGPVFVDVTPAVLKGAGVDEREHLMGNEQVFEVTCPSGYVVTVPFTFDDAALRQLMQTLEVG